MLKKNSKNHQEITEYRRNSPMKLCDVITPLTEKRTETKIKYFDQSQHSKKEFVSFNSGRTGTKTENRPIGIRRKSRKERI